MSKIQFPSSALGMIGLVIMLAGFTLDSMYNDGAPTFLGTICLVVGTSLMALGVVIGTIQAVINKERKQHGK